MDWAKEEAKWKDELSVVQLQLDEKTATVPWLFFDDLDDYSCTLPSGTVIGKFWKRHQPYSGRGAWWLGQYMPDTTDPENMVLIIWRELFIVTPLGGTLRATDDLTDSLRATDAIAV
jgi:hypothetical protein